MIRFQVPELHEVFQEPAAHACEVPVTDECGFAARGNQRAPAAQ